MSLDHRDYLNKNRYLHILISHFTKCADTTPISNQVVEIFASIFITWSSINRHVSPACFFQIRVDTVSKIFNKCLEYKSANNPLQLLSIACIKRPLLSSHLHTVGTNLVDTDQHFLVAYRVIGLPV